MTMLSSSLMSIWLSHIPNLVELPSSIQYFRDLKMLTITDCINLESLPTINLESLDNLNLTGCSKLKTFPDISRNISTLELSQTSIKEVPWWIEDFSKLKYLHMESCSKLKYVYLNISKLKHLEIIDFSDCGALTKVYLSDEASTSEMSSSFLPSLYFEGVQFKFTNCFNLEQEALLQQQTTFLEQMILPGEEVPSYFTHRTFTNSMSIPLPHTSLSQPIFHFRACAVVGYESPFIGRPSFHIQLSCQFEDIFDFFGKPDRVYPNHMKHSHLLVFDRYIHLNEDYSHLAKRSYDQVDIQIHISNTSENSTLKLKGWGIHIFKYCSCPNYFSQGFEGYETEESEESAGNDEDIETISNYFRS